MDRVEEFLRAARNRECDIYDFVKEDDEEATLKSVVPLKGKGIRFCLLFGKKSPYVDMIAEITALPEAAKRPMLRLLNELNGKYRTGAYYIVDDRVMYRFTYIAVDKHYDGDLLNKLVLTGLRDIQNEDLEQIMQLRWNY